MTKAGGSKKSGAKTRKLTVKKQVIKDLDASKKDVKGGGGATHKKCAPTGACLTSLCSGLIGACLS